MNCTLAFALTFVFALLLALPLAAQQPYNPQAPLAHTFSIVARDAETGEMAVGVQSHWFSVGSVVSWGKGGVGVVATQSFANKSFGPRGLALLEAGLTAQQALDSLIATDGGRAVRQVGIIDAQGGVAGWTGGGCIPYASHITGKGYSVQANMMLDQGVPEAMAAAFEGSEGKPLAERVLLALEAAQQAGGDIRGKQSAALLLVSGTPARNAWSDPALDLRVEDHATPIAELRRLYQVSQAYSYMNAGDRALEENDMDAALEAYGTAAKLYPDNPEVRYWAAITLANTGHMDEALNMLKVIFKEDDNWRELTRRLKPLGLLTVSDADYARIVGL